jgi:phosphohistidine phosphatase
VVETRHLFLLRHAKSSWDDASIDDHDRPLAPRGRRSAARIADYATKTGIRPDLILCSSATRARQTLERIAPSLGRDAEIRIERSLCGATEDRLLERLHALPEEVDSVMMIGHNPGVQDLAVLLAREGPLRTLLEGKFPTAGLASLAFGSVWWKDLDRKTGVLVDFVIPRRLGLRAAPADDYPGAGVVAGAGWVAAAWPASRLELRLEADGVASALAPVAASFIALVFFSAFLATLASAFAAFFFAAFFFSFFFAMLRAPFSHATSDNPGRG